MNAISTGEYRASNWDCVDAFPLFFSIMSFHMAALARVGRGGLPHRNALVELEPRPDGRRRFTVMEGEEQHEENENWAPPTPLNRRDEPMLAGGREHIVPLATPGAIRAENNPNMDDLNPMDTGLPVDPLQRVVIGFHR
jgi:hypothetical protein